MPLKLFTGAEAIANIRSNPYADWPSRTAADENRIEPMCKPAFKPSFELVPGEKIFTIGSCFARNVERVLMRRGFDVVTSLLAWPDRSIDTLGNGVLNNYGVASIENEFRWALDPDHPFDADKHLLEAAPGRYVDPHLPVRPAPRERIMSYREAITDVTRRVTECRVVIMTLGLSELWFDVQTATYLNRAPQRMQVARDPGRFELHLLDFAETMRSLEGALALLRKYCRPDQRILMTISPVPLGTTHVDDDVLVVNSYSKSVLRAAAAHIAAAHDNVDYFPSYESVMLSERALAWQDDQVHVQPELVQLNVERMVEAYSPRGGRKAPPDVELRLIQANDEIAAHNAQGAALALEPLRGAEGLEPEFLVPFAELCLRLNWPDDARAAMDKLPPSAGHWRRSLIEARLALYEGAGEKAAVILAELLQDKPKSLSILRAYIDALESLERHDEALAALKTWAEISRNSPEPFRRAAVIHRAKGDADAAERAYRAALATGKVNENHVLDFTEFLIEEKRLNEAAEQLKLFRPESRMAHRRAEALRAFLPSV
jgi:thioredoxin-like negative regulator of GroEL